MRHDAARWSLLAAAAALVVSCGGNATPMTPDSGVDPDAAPTCALDDSDGDGLADTSEGAPSVDTDDDGVPDYLDSDSDGDGLSDQLEAAGRGPCDMPADADGDGVPNARDLDSDGNGIADGDEPDGDLDGDGEHDAHDLDDDGDAISDVTEIGAGPAPAADSDGDGTPDYRDTDSDGDGIPDRVEGLGDLDDDGIPAYQDTDSDGDGIPDAAEAGPDPTAPLNSDGDNLADFEDTDSDNDGLADHQEDVNQNGVLDPGESDIRDPDTDGDGYPDVVEWAAGTDPGDPTSVLDADDFYFLLPYLGPEQQDDLDFTTNIKKADVFFQIDTTGSMGGTIATLQTSLQTLIVPEIAAQVADVAMGAGFFRDFPVSPFGDPGDLPFVLTQRITTDIEAVQAGIDALTAGGGNDVPESGMEALYQAVTGEGIAWSVAPEGEVPKFQAFIDYDPERGHGFIGGAGFRKGALPIIVHATDAPFHDGTEYQTAGIHEAHSRDEAVAAARALGARFVGITSHGASKAALKEIARLTGAMVAPTAWGAGASSCRTGVNGGLEVPESDGLCPLAFSMSSGGSGVALQVVEALEALVRFATLDISALAVGDPLALPELDTARFIAAIEPEPPAPAGATISGLEFEDVQPGQPVRFRVRARNDVVEGGREAQLFRVTIRVVGDRVTALDERDVFIVVPGASFVP